MPSGRKPKYTRTTFRAAVDKYFQSICYTAPLLNRDGKPQLNDDGEEIKLLRYAKPPCKSALCLFLGIDRSTWQNYANAGLHPELADICEEACARIEVYLEEELLTRQKSVQGIIFNLQNNYGWKQKQEVEIGEDTRKQMAAGSVSLEEKLAVIASEHAARAHAADEEGSEGRKP